jgi:hypothetical protein
VAKVQTNSGRIYVAAIGDLKYERKRGLTAHTVTESKPAPAACPITAAIAKLLHCLQRTATKAIAIKLSMTVKENTTIMSKVDKLVRAAN